jgi:uncharacterized membrane protein
MKIPVKGRSIAFSTPEGRILVLGLALSLLYAIFLVVSYFTSPQNFQVFIGMTATNILFGRAAGMSFGYALDFGHLVVLPVNLAIESILVLLVYPLFVFSWQRLLVIRALERFMQRVEEAAERHKEKIQRYGIPSLFLFVLFPFWMTGPVVGCVIGFFLGLRPWINIGVVLSATALACLGWAILLKRLHDQMSDFSPFAPLILLVVIVAVAVAGYILESRRHDNHRP